MTEEDLKTKIRTLIKDSFVSINIGALDDFERVFLQHYVEDYHKIIQKIYALVNFPNFKVGWTYEDGEGTIHLILWSNNEWIKTYRFEPLPNHFLDDFDTKGFWGGHNDKSSRNLIHSTGKKWETEE